MQKELLIVSPSTKEYFEHDNRLVFNGKLSHLWLEITGIYERVVVCGGGACIDLAKIISNNEIIAYPTTASGATHTSHAVVWRDREKVSVKRRIPTETIIKKQFFEKLPETVKQYTFCDAISHCIDSLGSLKSTNESRALATKAKEMLTGAQDTENLIKAGIIAGQAIEITPTTLLHALSYPMTGIYGIPHGKALGILLKYLKPLVEFDIEEYYNIDIESIDHIDFELVALLAYRYNKIQNFHKPISIDDITRLF
jgi:alcohol dehydrogenase class IV